MASFLATRLKQELDAINAVYDSKFAGQSRASRDIAEIDGLIRRTKNVLQQIDATPASGRDDELTAARQTAADAVALYESERVAINEAKSAGPEFEQFAPLAQTANFVMARYRRHFAGKNRATRDTGLLDDMINDLSDISAQMSGFTARNSAESFHRDLETVTRSLEMYRTEREEVLRAQQNGSVDEQSGTLASLANGQFDLYREHFAGRSRTSRRPELLERMIRQLEKYKTRMQDLTRTDSVAQMNRDNVKIVDENLTMYARELVEVRKARQSAKIDDLVGTLGGAANEVFDEYRNRYANKDRKTVDADRLSVMCDLLGEIERQMAAIDRAVDNSVNEKNLEIVRGQLSSFESEWDQVSEAQKRGR